MIKNLTLNSALSFIALVSMFGIVGCNSKPAQKAHTTWSHYGGSPDQSKYFDGSEITKENVDQLEVAWFYPTQDNAFYNFAPIVVDTVMYVLGKNSSLIALSVNTGKEIWIHAGLQGITRRGLNYWESKDKKYKRLIYTLNNSLQAIDATTGLTVTTFGDNGHVDMRVGLDRDPTSIRRMQSMMPGVIFEDLVIIGSAPGEGYFSPPGHVRAYSVVTGKLEWTFHTIPHPGEYGYETWPKDAYKYVGAVNVWSEISVDTKRGVAYLPLGSPTYDYYGGDRQGANLFGNCLVAVDARTGKRIWHYQTVHHDLWDYDLSSAPQMMTVNHDGKEIDAIAVATKQGFLFVLNRDTGEPIFPIEEKPFPATTMPGDKAWPTQPIPTHVPPYTPHSVTKETLNPYFTEEVKQTWHKRLDAAKSGLYIPPSDQYETVTMPGALGGSSYGNTAANPHKGIMYIQSQDYASIYKLSKVEPPRPALSADETKKVLDLYASSCEPCHGKDMQGGASVAIRDVGQRMQYEEFKTTITEGKGRMPAFVHVEEATLSAFYRYVGGMPARFNMNRGGAGGEPPKIEGPVVATGGAKITPDAKSSPAMADYPEGVERPENRYSTGYGTEWQGLGSPPWASIFAYDLNTGTIKWRQPIGIDSAFTQGDRSAGAPSGTQRKGMIVTSTGIVFATGKGGIIYAFDEDNGNILWETFLSNESSGQPGMFTVNGKEYLVVNATQRFDRDSYDLSKKPGALPKGYVVYALPDRKP